MISNGEIKEEKKKMPFRHNRKIDRQNIIRLCAFPHRLDRQSIGEAPEAATQENPMNTPPKPSKPHPNLYQPWIKKWGQGEGFCRSLFLWTLKACHSNGLVNTSTTVTSPATF
jgi:hypothetical protein